jgi:hypothetical protein
LRSSRFLLLCGLSLAWGCTPPSPYWLHTQAHPDYSGTRFVTAVGSTQTRGLEPHQYRQAALEDALRTLAGRLLERSPAFRSFDLAPQRAGGGTAGGTTRSLVREAPTTGSWPEETTPELRRLEVVQLLDAFLDDDASRFSIFALVDTEHVADLVEERLSRDAVQRREIEDDLGGPEGVARGRETLALAGQLITVASRLRQGWELLAALRPSSAPRLAAVRLPEGIVLSLRPAAGEGGRDAAARYETPLVLEACLAFDGDPAGYATRLPGIRIRAVRAHDAVLLSSTEETTDAAGRARFGWTAPDAVLGAATVTFAAEVPELDGEGCCAVVTVALAPAAAPLPEAAATPASAASPFR